MVVDGATEQQSIKREITTNRITKIFLILQLFHYFKPTCYKKSVGSPAWQLDGGEQKDKSGIQAAKQIKHDISNYNDAPESR